MGNIIIAGGATGIGRAAVRGFRARGDNVLLVDHRPQAADLVAEQAPGAIRFIQRDLAEPDAPADSVNEAIATYGSLDTVLITAALMLSAPLSDWKREMWDRTVALNLRMPFLFAQAAAPHLAKSDNASIILISSTGAIRGHAGMSGYQATKAALPGLCRSLTAELGPLGIRINTLMPGWIDTPFNDPFWEYQDNPDARRVEIEQQIPLRRQGQPEEVSSMVLFLASPAGRYIAGTSIVIDGGYTAV
jgi:NAD(P)-dependent dehydrogenase (short-subunit alcohol dehydrogenase family)